MRETRRHFRFGAPTRAGNPPEIVQQSLEQQRMRRDCAYEFAERGELRRAQSHLRILIQQREIRRARADRLESTRRIRRKTSIQRRRRRPEIRDGDINCGINVSPRAAGRSSPRIADARNS